MNSNSFSVRQLDTPFSRGFFNGEFIEGFSWPILEAHIRTGVASFGTFKQGDIFYNDARAYSEGWAFDNRPYTLEFQIAETIRSPIKTHSENASQTDELLQSTDISDTWFNTLIVNTWQNEHGRKTMSTTVGQLYLTLWTGNTDYIFLNIKGDNPFITVEHAYKYCHHIEPIARTLHDLHRPKGSTFLFGYDLANTHSLEKYTKIIKTLNKDNISFTINEIKFSDKIDGKHFLPTLTFRAISATTSEENLKELIKRAIYVNKGTKRQKFVLERHGMLITSRTAFNEIAFETYQASI